MKYTLMKGRDSRDNVMALWLLRTAADGAKECAYLGKCPPIGEQGKHAARVKQITMAKPEFYVFEPHSSFARNCDYASVTRVDTWEAV